MAAQRGNLILFFFMSFSVSLGLGIVENDSISFLSSIAEFSALGLGKHTNYLTNWLEFATDKILVNSEAGRMLHYEELKTEIEKAQNAIEGRSAKKLSAILPIIFFLGMSAAGVLLTTLLSAKAVTIGLVLLLLKIAVGSAKVASYLTAWKLKDHHHYEYIPHHEHHGHIHKRSLRNIETLAHHDWHGHSDYSSHDHPPSPYHAHEYGEYEYPVETKAEDKKIIVKEEPCLQAKKKYFKMTRSLMKQLL